MNKRKDAWPDKGAMRRKELMTRLSRQGEARKAACPDALKRRVRSAIHRNGDGLKHALKKFLDLGPDEVGVVDKVICELPELARRWKASAVLGLVRADEAHQHTDSAAHRLAVGNGLEAVVVVGGHVVPLSLVAYVAKYLAKGVH